VEDKVKSFLEVIEAICKVYGLSITHEDEHGAFIIEDYKETNIEWLKEATINIKEENIKNEDY
jgi:hypothetical protein